jgi:hypothetical protein
VTDVLLRHLPGRTEGNHEKLQPGQFVFHQDSNQTFPANKSRVLSLTPSDSVISYSKISKELTVNVIKIN